MLNVIIIIITGDNVAILSTYIIIHGVNKYVKIHLLACIKYTLKECGESIKINLFLGRICSPANSINNDIAANKIVGEV